MPGSRSKCPARAKATVATAPATRGGARPSANLRAGLASSGCRSRRAFHQRGGGRDRHRHHGQRQPGGEPALASRPAAGPRAGGHRDAPDQRQPPSGERGEGRCALHRLPDEAQVAEGALVEGGGSVGQVVAGGTAQGHAATTPASGVLVKYFVMQSQSAASGAARRGSLTLAIRRTSATRLKPEPMAKTVGKPAASARRPARRGAANAMGATAVRPSPT